MISIFRAFLNTWAAKLFFMLLIGVFVIWGVGDVLTQRPTDTAVATVGGRRIEMDEVADSYRRQLSQVTRMLGGTVEPTMDMKRGVAAQALERLITQVALTGAAQDMGLSYHLHKQFLVRQGVIKTAHVRSPSVHVDEITQREIDRLLTDLIPR